MWPKDLRGLKIFDSDNLAQLAACTIRKQIIPAGSTKKNSSIPIYIPSSPLQTWPEINEKGNLIVLVRTEVRDGTGLYKDIFHQRIFVVSVSYYRKGGRMIDDSSHGCSEAFPYFKDEDALKKLLTISLHVCLDRPYYAYGK
jgi:hypothetical protein